MCTPWYAQASAALRRSFQSSTQNAKWCRPRFEPVITAMSWEVCETSSQVAIWKPSSPMTCSVSRKSSISRRNAVTVSTSSAVRNRWSRRGGAMPVRFIGRGGGLVRGSRLPTCSMPCTSSIRCPLGRSKRMAWPCPGPHSPFSSRCTGTPAASRRPA